MKKFWACFAIFWALCLTVDVAHAKRMGGGKSFGRSHQTAPQPKRAQDAQPAQRQAADKAAPGAGKKGMMGGLLGGLLVGGLFAALFAGGAFEGLQLMDIVLIALLAFVILKVIQSLRRPAARQPQPMARESYATAGAPPVFGQRQEVPVSTSVPAGVAVPFNLPLGFDTPAFIEGAKEHYRVLQLAWNENDLPRLREYLSPALYRELEAERATLARAPQTDILSVDAELVRADQVFGNAEVSIRFSGQYRDLAEGVNEPFVDIWHLERDYSKTDAPWFIVGIESA